MKATRRGKSRIKPKNSQAAVFRAVVNHYGGLTRTANHISRELGLPFTKWTLSNWIYRGKVPLLYLERISRALGVTPYVLNYVEYSDFKDSDDMTWDEAVSSVPFLHPRQRERIASLPHPE